MGNTSKIGDIAEAKVLAALVSKGYNVLVPFGDHLRYDLAIEEKGQLKRIQVKNGRLRKGAVIFSVASYDYKGEYYTYEEDAELFGVYCKELDNSYLIPVGEVKTRAAYLRVETAKNNQSAGIRLAENFEI